jgi:hypothetical protein
MLPHIVKKVPRFYGPRNLDVKILPRNIKVYKAVDTLKTVSETKKYWRTDVTLS